MLLDGARPARGGSTRRVCPADTSPRKHYGDTHRTIGRETWSRGRGPRMVLRISGFGLLSYRSVRLVYCWWVCPHKLSAKRSAASRSPNDPGVLVPTATFLGD